MLNRLSLGKLALVALSAMSLSNFALAAKAASVSNGSFETTTGIVPGELGYNANVSPWTATGYSFVFAPGTADNGTGAPNKYGDTTQLWGPGNGSNNGLTTSPDGGNFVALDADATIPGVTPGPSSISQTISGLTPGQQYTVTFNYAGAQQEGADPVSKVPYDQPTTTTLSVSLGGQTLTTPTLNNAGKGFTGWQQGSLTFTADGTSDVLKFLAGGGPSGQPPFVLLDGVSIKTDVPEAPVYIGAMVALGLGGVLRTKLAKKK